MRGRRLRSVFARKRHFDKAVAQPRQQHGGGEYQRQVQQVGGEVAVPEGEHFPYAEPHENHHAVYQVDGVAQVAQFGKAAQVQQAAEAVAVRQNREPEGEPEPLFP